MCRKIGARNHFACKLNYLSSFGKWNLFQNWLSLDEKPDLVFLIWYYAFQDDDGYDVDADDDDDNNENDDDEVSDDEDDDDLSGVNFKIGSL